MFIMMSSVLKKFSSSLKPVYVVSLTRLVSTSSCQLVSDSGAHSSDSTKSSSNRFEDKSNLHVDHSTHQEQSSYESDVKNKILDASLQFVSVHGWNKNAISAGAETLGYPGVIHGMFPRGGFDLIQHFYITSNKNLVDFLIKEYPDSNPSDDTKSEVEEGGRRNKIEKAVKVRLEMIQPYIKQWPQALAVMSLPPNVPTSLANLLCLVDDIFYFTGDKSVDLSWYSRRVVLAGIYKATELYMLQDNSIEYMNTWEFLHRRMDEASQVRSYMKASEQASQVAKEFATSAFITARSILGLSWNR